MSPTQRKPTTMLSMVHDTLNEQWYEKEWKGWAKKAENVKYKDKVRETRKKNKKKSSVHVLRGKLKKQKCGYTLCSFKTYWPKLASFLPSFKKRGVGKHPLVRPLQFPKPLWWMVCVYECACVYVWFLFIDHCSREPHLANHPSVRTRQERKNMESHVESIGRRQRSGEKRR